MKNLFTYSKKITLNLIVILALIVSTIISFGINFLTINNAVKAEVSLDYKSTAIEVADSDFETDNSTFPANLSSWTKVGDSSKKVTSGVIDLESENFNKHSEDYKISVNPGVKSGVTGTQVLMINAEDNYTKSGYKTPAFNLNANSFFHISVDVLTDTVNGASASIKVIAESFEDNDNVIESISTFGVWKDYHFYIATYLFGTNSVQVELNLGSDSSNAYSYVLFDNLKVEEISQKDFELKQQQVAVPIQTESVITRTKLINLQKQNLIPADVNADFEDGITGWTKTTQSNTVQTESTIVGAYKIGVGANFNTEATSAEEPNNGYRMNNNYALLLNNKVANSIGVKSKDITAKRHGFYVLTIQAKTNEDFTGSAAIKITQNNPYETESFVAAQETLTVEKTSNSENLSKGAWATYKFFIKGNYFTDTTFNVELILGGESTATGYIWFDNMQLFEITSKEFDDNSTEETKCKAINMNANITSTELTVKNGFFNYVIKESIEENTLTPADWTIGATNLANATIIETVDNYSNVLKLTTKKGNSDAKAVISAQSATVNSAANAYNKLSFDAKVEELKDGKAFISLLEGETSLYIGEIVEYNNNWKHYEIVVKEGDFARNLTINFNIGKDNYPTCGTIYIDNVKFESVTEDVYNNATTKLNLETENFTSNQDKLNNTVAGLKVPTNFTATNASELTNENVNAGILDTANFENEVINAPILMGINNPGSNNGNSVMALCLYDYGYYYFTSTKTYSLSSDTYYKLVVNMKTVGLSHEEVENEDKLSFGAFISLPEIEGATIKAIETNETENNGYKTYTLYIYSASAKSTTIRFGLGQQDALTKGILFIDDMSLVTSNEEEFETNEKLSDDSILTIRTVKDETEEEKPEEETTEPENKVDFNFLLIPTLITSLAILVAIVGSIVRKYAKLPAKKKKSINYDRTVVEEDHNLRESLAIKEQELVQYNEELELAQKEYNELPEATEEMTDMEIDKLTGQKLKVQNKINLLKDKVNVTTKKIAEINKKLGR